MVGEYGIEPRTALPTNEETLRYLCPHCGTQGCRGKRRSLRLPSRPCTKSVTLSAIMYELNQVALLRYRSVTRYGHTSIPDTLFDCHKLRSNSYRMQAIDSSTIRQKTHTQ